MRRWAEAWLGVVTLVGAREASCKGGRHSEPTAGSLVWDCRWSRGGGEVES